MRPSLQNNHSKNISKITRAKITGAMSQAAEHLPHKCEAPSSNPRTTTKKKNSYPCPFSHIFTTGWPLFF
jgi:hypothetical protein